MKEGLVKLNKKFGVDAGHIAFMDVEWVKKNGGLPERAVADGDAKILKVEPGTREVSYSIKNTWRQAEPLIGIEKVEVPCGELYVGDPCYAWSGNYNVREKWMKFLGKTKFFENMGKFGIAVSTGGDGSFPVKVEVR